jgi:hypothetical protein
MLEFELIMREKLTLKKVADLLISRLPINEEKLENRKPFETAKINKRFD